MSNNTNTEEEFKTTDKNFELRFYNKKGYLNKNLIQQIGYSILFFGFFITFFIMAEVNYFIFNVEDYTLIPELIMSKEFHIFLIPEVKDWFIEEIQGVFSREFVVSLLVSISMPIYAIYRMVKWVKKKALIQANLSSLNLSQYYLFKVDLKQDIYTFKLIKGETMNYDTFTNSRDNLCQLFGYTTMKAKREGDNKIIVAFNRAFPTIEDNEVKELNKTIEKYEKKGYMTLGYSNVSDENVVEEKVGNLFIKYMPLKDLNIHMKLVGASGFGKSVNFATLLRNFMNLFNEIDTLFIHDFKGIESNRMTKFIESSSQKEDLEKRIITSTTIEDLEDILIKLKIVYEYRKKIMNDNDWLNYRGGKIIVMIDEFNIGMSALESKNKFERKKAEQVERMLKDFALLYRAMNMYLIIVGQSNQVQDNWSSTLNKQTSIGFLLKSSTEIASRFNSEAYEEGIDASTFRKGEVLYSNQNNSSYFKFLSAYLDENFLFDMGDINITERQDIDNNMFKLAIQLKEKLKNENKNYYDKLLKSGDVKEEEYEKELEDYNELIDKNIEEIADYKFLVKEEDNFEFVSEEEFDNTEMIIEEIEEVEEEIIEEVKPREVKVKIDFQAIAQKKIKAKQAKREEDSEVKIDLDLEEAFNNFEEEEDLVEEEMIEAKTEIEIEEQFKAMEEMIKQAPEDKEELKKEARNTEKKVEEELNIDLNDF